MHPDQLRIPVQTVRALVADQFPAWRDLPVRPAGAAGTVNAIFRIGDRLAARFLGALWYYADSNPPMSRMGRRTLERLLGQDR